MNRFVAVGIALTLAGCGTDDTKSYPPDQMIGVAHIDSTGGCLMIARKSARNALSPGTSLTFVDVPETVSSPGDSAVAVTGEVGEPIASNDERCRLMSGIDSAHYYGVRLPRDSARGARFAILTSAVEIRGPLAFVRFPGDTTKIALRSCHSREGQHLTAWTGDTLRPPRVVHAYYNLGYDMARSSCSEAETAPLPARGERWIASTEHVPACVAEPGRLAHRILGELTAGKAFSETTPGGWILTLRPNEDGWFLSVTTRGRETEDLSRLTIPFHAANPRDIYGWYFRNADNTGPNDGSVNAPGRLRHFIFSPRVGRDLHPGSNTTMADVEAVEAFGRGWFYIDEFELTPPKAGTRASFTRLDFTACLTWPA